MGAALLELEHSLRSQKEYLTSQEAGLLQVCRSNALRALTFFSLVGASTAWGVTWKLSTTLRVNLAAGVSCVMGSWGCNRSLESCVQHILSRDGSRLQRELATIMVTRHGHAASTRRILSKRFYMETVFDDSSPHEVNLRWRYRMHSGIVIPNDGQHSGDPKPHDNDYNKNSQAESDTKTVDLKPKQVDASPRMTNSKSHHADITEDPIDSLFGAVAPLEEIQHPATPAPAPATRAQHRSHRRSHRARRRMRHHEALL